MNRCILCVHKPGFLTLGQICLLIIFVSCAHMISSTFQSLFHALYNTHHSPNSRAVDSKDVGRSSMLPSVDSA